MSHSVHYTFRLKQTFTNRLKKRKILGYINALEKNTLSCYGFETGTYVDVPDIESEQGITTKHINTNIEIVDSQTLKANKQRIKEKLDWIIIRILIKNTYHSLMSHYPK